MAPVASVRPNAIQIEMQMIVGEIRIAVRLSGDGGRQDTGQESTDIPQIESRSYASERRVILRAAAEPHQEAGLLPKPDPIVCRTYLTALFVPVRRSIGRTSSVRLRNDCVRLQAQHGSIRFGRSSSIIARMRLNRLRGTA